MDQTNNIKTALKNYATEFNQAIAQYFNFPKGEESRVSRAMFYSLSKGGKRLRPFLVFEVGKLFGVSFEQSLNTAVALEMLHTYSLVHDDLPAMDNDDLRRGFPTCHKQYDEATAIIAGDGLLTYAFEILSRPQTSPDAQIRCCLIEMLANAAGAFTGMVAGQMLDLIGNTYTHNNEEAEDIIKRIEEMKTGRLLRFAVEAGAVLGKADSNQAAALISYSRKIGIAFQIADDILDIEGSTQVVGKTLNKDKGQKKLTLVTLYGVETARNIAQELVYSACRDIDIFGFKARNLKEIAQYIVDRTY